VVTKSLFSIIFASVTLFTVAAHADLPEVRESVEKNVTQPLTKELNDIVTRNTELTEWNEKHNGTLTKLNKIVGTLNKGWNLQNPQANVAREKEMRETLTAIWSLETDKAIGTVTDLKGMLIELRDSKRPDDKNAFQFSGRTRQDFFDFYIGKIDEIIKASENEIDPITMMKRMMASVEFRKGPHDIDYPTIVKGQAGYEATPKKEIETARIATLNEILAASTKLNGALKGCPSPKFLEEQLAKIADLNIANEAEIVRIAGEITKANNAFTEAVDGAKGVKQTRVGAEAKAQADRDKLKKDSIKAAVLEMMNLSVISLDEKKDNLALEGKDVTSADAEKTLVDAIVKDVRSVDFTAVSKDSKDNGHKKFLSAMEKLGSATISENDPATVLELSGLPLANDLFKKIVSRRTHSVVATKLDLVKVETLPSKIADLVKAADEKYSGEMAAIKLAAETNEGKLLATKTARLEELATESGKAEAKKAKLASEKTALMSCSTKLAPLIEHVKGLDKTATKDVLEKATHDVNGITTESDVESLRPVQK